MLQIGLYMELKDDRNATIVHFLPSSPALFAQLRIEPDNAKLLLRYVLQHDPDLPSYTTNLGNMPTIDALQLPSTAYTLDVLLQAVYTLSKHVDLEAMKQDALVHYWLSQVAFDDF
jgi:hypothetical protein